MSPQRRLRRTWPQRFLLVFNVACIVTALLGAGTLAYAKAKVAEIPRVDVSSSDFAGTSDVAPTEPRNFLLVGADTDDGLPPDAAERVGRDKGPDAITGVRSDTIMIVRVDPGKAGAQILSIPRDLWVSIPGKASKNKINATLEFGGPKLLIDTIRQTFGIEINNYVQVDFAGFKTLVGQLGGIPMYFDRPVRDLHIGLDITGPACVTLDPDQALKYVRSRYFQYQQLNGKFRGDGTGDYGRVSRQQDFIRRVINRAKQQGLRNPVKLKNYLDVAVSNVTLDGQTTVGQLVGLGKAFRNFESSDLVTYSLPTFETKRGGADTLDLDAKQSAPILARFRVPVAAPPAGDVAPDSVSVRVLNGSNTPNQASVTSKALGAIGYRITSIDGTAPVKRTEVRFPPGQDGAALSVARHLQADPLLVPDPAVDVVTVVTGPDFQAVLSAARPASDITTTTAPPVSVPPQDQTTTTASTTTTEPIPTTTVAGFVPGDPPAGVACG